LKPNRNKRALGFVLGSALVAGLIVLQVGVFSRLVGVYETKIAEALPEGVPETSEHLEKAIAADPSYGWAYWLLSKEHLARAQAAGENARRYGAAAAAARKAGRANQAAILEAAAEKAAKERTDELLAAEELALKGLPRFNSVGCFKQLASIYLRLERPAQAEHYLDIVARIKPDDIEAIERLGLLKLNAKKWDELENLCERILRRHPYSANAYFYKAFIAREKRNRDEFFLDIRQAYLMMRQHTGTIFFNPRQLEDIMKTLGMMKKLLNFGPTP